MPQSQVEAEFAGRTLSLETGKLAKQATGSALVRYGDTVILATVVEGPADPTRDFFPLTVDYREKTYAAGKFPGGYIKRETKPGTKETLTSRLTDRPIRPLFPTGYKNELQIQLQVLAADKDNDPDILAMIGASCCLAITDIPFLTPTGSVRVAQVNNELVAMPTYAQLEESDLDLIVSGTRDAVTMIEGFAREMPEDRMVEAIMFAHKHLVQGIDLIEKLREAGGKPPREKPPEPEPNPAYDEMYEKYAKEFKEVKLTKAKLERYEKVAELKTRIKAEYLPEEGEPKFEVGQVVSALSALEEKVFREIVLDGQRLDGRQPKELRDVECEVGVLPRVHGSAVFTRGETQALVVATLGTGGDEQKVEGLQEEFSKKFMLDYNFPPFSVGEVKPIRGPGRREIGHGMLAERSLKAVIPMPNKFAYTIRLVSEILESNGSSSMASVCGGTLALMDAGVPIRHPVAGISIGLVKEPDKFILLTDIQGDEDHYGDMDFKVAGTQRGITGIQLDLKIDGINEEIIRETLQQARDARIEILRTMLGSLRQPRGQISDFAPRLLTVKINPEKIGLLIGPGGKNIKAIQESTGAKIDIEEDGTVHVSHSDAEGAEAAKLRVEAIGEDVKVGRTYEGKVTSVKEFGAFVEIMPGRDGLVHISELSDKYVGRVEDICKVGDRMEVKVIGIDDQDRVKLSRKALMASEDDDEVSDDDEDKDSGGGGGRNGGRSKSEGGGRRRRSSS